MKYPNANFTCVDIAGKMLEIAWEKIGGDLICIQADFNRFEFTQKYDFIVSSLALHHIDVVLGSDNDIQDVYLEKWKEFMRKSVSIEEIDNKWLPNYYAEDRPTQLTTHLDMLKECGFSSVDVVYKYFNYAVYMGKR